LRLASSRLHGLDHSAWLPAVIGAAILLLIALVAVGAPVSIRGSAVLAAACVLFVIAYVVWPKPTLLVFALFVLFYHTIGRWLTPDLRHIDEILVPVLFVLAFFRTKPWRRDMIDPLREGALVVMLVAGIGSSLVSNVPASVWLLGLLLLFKMFAFFYIALWHEYNEADVRQLYPLVLAIGIVVVALVPLEVLDPDRFRSILNLSDISTPRVGLPSVKSLFYRPILFSWFTAFVGLFLVAGYVYLRRWWLLIGAALFGVATILSGRRRAISGVAVALIAGIGAHWWAERSSRATLRAWWPVAAGSLLLGIAFLPSLVGLADMTVAPGPETPDARIALYNTSVLIARDRFPFGVGLGRYGSGTSRDPYSPVYHEYGLDKIDGLSPQHSAFISDTFWPRILGETGVIGLAALLVFTVVLTIQVWRAALTRHTDMLIRAFLLGTWMVFVQSLVETLASSMFDSPPRIYLLFGTVAVALAVARNSKTPELAAGATPSPTERSGVQP
jgi:hypothetical protein